MRRFLIIAIAVLAAVYPSKGHAVSLSDIFDAIWNADLPVGPFFDWLGEVLNGIFQWFVEIVNKIPNSFWGGAFSIAAILLGFYWGRDIPEDVQKIRSPEEANTAIALKAASWFGTGVQLFMCLVFIVVGFLGLYLAVFG